MRDKQFSQFMTVVAIVMSAAPLLWAQSRDDNSRRRGSWGRGSFSRSAWNNPEERERMYTGMVDHYMDNFTRDYDLNATQSAQVRQQLDQLKQKQLEGADARQQEYQSLRKQEDDLREQEQAGQQVDHNKIDELRDRRHDLYRNLPLTDYRKVTEQVESLLPPDQVAKGRKNHEQRRNEWQRRNNSGVTDRWQRYVEFFSRRLQLDASQRATANALLRDLTQQRDAYQKSHEADYAAAAQIADAKEKQDRLTALNAPIDQMYEQLKSKLDQIPTAAQKAAAPPPSTFDGSANGGSQSSTTRPSWSGRRSGPGGSGRSSRSRDRE